MKVLFLDRDGILNPPPFQDNGGYLTKWQDFTFQDGIVDLLDLCKKKSIPMVVITNQQCIGKGIITVSDLDSIHNQIQTLLEPKQIRIEKFYYCPHLKSDNCDCRKPKPGMLIRAMQDGGWNPEDCGFLGDSKTDMQAGIAAKIPHLFYYKTKEEDLSDLPPGSFQRIRTFVEVLQ